MHTKPSKGYTPESVCIGCRTSTHLAYGYRSTYVGFQPRRAYTIIQGLHYRSLRCNSDVHMKLSKGYTSDYPV